MKCPMLFKSIYLVVILLQVTVLVAQDEPKSLTAKFIAEEIQLDGALDEAVRLAQYPNGRRYTQRNCLK